MNGCGFASAHIELLFKWILNEVCAIKESPQPRQQKLTADAVNKKKNNLLYLMQHTPQKIIHLQCLYLCLVLSHIAFHIPPEVLMQEKSA